MTNLRLNLPLRLIEKARESQYANREKQGIREADQKLQKKTNNRAKEQKKIEKKDKTFGGQLEHEKKDRYKIWTRRHRGGGEGLLAKPSNELLNGDDSTEWYYEFDESVFEGDDSTSAFFVSFLTTKSIPREFIVFDSLDNFNVVDNVFVPAVKKGAVRIDDLYYYYHVPLNFLYDIDNVYNISLGDSYRYGIAQYLPPENSNIADSRFRFYPTLRNPYVTGRESYTRDGDLRSSMPDSARLPDIYKNPSTLEALAKMTESTIEFFLHIPSEGEIVEEFDRSEYEIDIGQKGGLSPFLWFVPSAATRRISTNSAFHFKSLLGRVSSSSSDSHFSFSFTIVSNRKKEWSLLLFTPGYIVAVKFEIPDGAFDFPITSGKRHIAIQHKNGYGNLYLDGKRIYANPFKTYATPFCSFESYAYKEEFRSVDTESGEVSIKRRDATTIISPDAPAIGFSEYRFTPGVALYPEDEFEPPTSITELEG